MGDIVYRTKLINHQMLVRLLPTLIVLVVILILYPNIRDILLILLGPLFLYLLFLLPFPYVSFSYGVEGIKIKYGLNPLKTRMIPLDLIVSVSLVIFSPTKDFTGIIIGKGHCEFEGFELWIRGISSKCLPWMSASGKSEIRELTSLVPVEEFGTGIMVKTSGTKHYIISDWNPEETLKKISEVYPVDPEAYISANLKRVCGECSDSGQRE